ncbi:MAG: lysine 2,3-aminomutase, partial [Hyphomicrobiaceae bacterium]|nr:lysine 2,3-aminomutase [Hyphomicrobiaceae bacterium]
MHTLAALRDAGLIDTATAAPLAAVTDRYAVAVPPAMAALIARDSATGLGIADDPIARQFLPDARELEHHPTENADPIGDHGKTVAPGVVHRYPDRVLLKLSGVCPVYCRFCFRREMVGPGAGTTLDA